MPSQKKVYIIAEAGVNHNGSLKIAKKLVDVAMEAGVDAVKFQTFKAEKLVLKKAPIAVYQKNNSFGKTHFEMLKSLELEESDFKELYDYCRKKKIDFLSSPFDVDSVKFLHQLGLKIFKIPSGEITNYPYLRNIGLLKKKVILSTGMSTMPEVIWALDVLTHAGSKKKDITVLHCNTEYPTPYEDVNLRVMTAMKEELKMGVGYSDHTEGIQVSVAAVALGAEVIEKHFTLDKAMKGPDHRASLDPVELGMLVRSIRDVEKSMGSKIKAPSKSEFKNIKIARKSIVALKDIKKGENFSESNLTTMRPGLGISAMKWKKVVGRKALRNYKKNEMI